MILWPETAFTGPLTSTEIIRLIRDGEKVGGMEVGEKDYMPIATLSPQK